MPKLSSEDQVRSSSHLDLPAKTLNSGAVLLPPSDLSRLLAGEYPAGLMSSRRRSPFPSVVFDTRRYLVLSPGLYGSQSRTGLNSTFAVDDQIMPTLKEGDGNRRIFLQRKDSRRAHRRHSAVLQLLRMSGKKLRVIFFLFSLPGHQLGPCKISQVR